MSSEVKVFTLEDVRKHNKPDDLWIVIHDKVYDLTKFASEHPGGETVLEQQAGDYGTEPFEDVGHSSDAREVMEQYYIGEIAPADRERKSKFTSSFTLKKIDDFSFTRWSGLLIPIGVVVVAIIVYKCFV
ncbi:putative cytochrome b5 [Schistosoma mansoni]|uniref:Cytochrome b5 n=1 Tax=Schistosoma mansoni TaxID=6183 RepID=G4VP31_SCHMA|nr:putative cytochrome b5 [Schistosoma mansoni]|eukprot:XP_018654905.1 putative cytochrome b5 [Schistosoma mansoni]